jgi:hypothetical protein
MMKTDQLISLLSTNVDSIEAGRLGRTVAWALAIGGFIAFCTTAATVGFRPDLGSSSSLIFVALKLLFSLTFLGIGAGLLVKAIRPGRDIKGSLRVIVAPFAIAILVAAALLAAGHPSSWMSLPPKIMWAGPLVCIPVFAVVPLGVLIWALRKGAPTNLRRTGTIAGLVAGATAASAYAFSCPVDSVPFIALWYGAAIALCAAVGAIVGPRLLRW